MSSARCKQLLGWYRDNARDLPWRNNIEPYPVWVSEIMLQQTRVKTVLSRFAHWLRPFPNIKALASAGVDDVMKAWEGLGYYRRARLLHQSARIIMDRFGGIFPKSFDDILTLPGIGRSTAGAIASVCFDAPYAVLDGNVRRVLRRWYGKPEVAEKRLWQWAQAFVDQATHPGDWNQAMMELGATVCTPKSPDCASCPVAEHCASAFRIEVHAARKMAVAVRNVHWQVHLHTDPERGIWLVRRPAAGIWAGLWSPPIIELRDKPDIPPCHVHTLTHRRLHLYGKVVEHAPAGGGQWVVDIETLALPTGIHRLLAKHGLG